MGKGNRVKNSKAQYAADNESVFTAKKEKNSMPAWAATLIIVLVLVLLLAFVVGCFISDGGYLLGLTKVAESDNYSVSASMLSYLFRQSYNGFLNQYGSIVQYMGLDTKKSLKSQESPEKGKTWFDYFMEPTVKEVEKILVYCEEAKALGIELDDEDKKEIDEIINTLEAGAETYGYSVKEYISLMYGNGVRLKDVRKCLEMSQLAAKCSEQLENKTKGAISDDEILKYYNENTGKFLSADILSYTFTVNKNTEPDKYDENKADAKKSAEELAKCKTEKEFKQYVIDYLIGRSYDAVYTSHTEKLEADKMPTSEVIAEQHDKIIANVRESILEGKEIKPTESTDPIEKLFSDIEIDLAEDMNETVNSMSNGSYQWTDDKENEAGLWLSANDRKAGDTKAFEDEKSDEKSTSFTSTVYYVVEPMKRDETASRNVGHILIKPASDKEKDTAKKKAEEILEKFKSGTMSKEEFEKLAKENTADSGIFYDNVVPGQMVSEFEDWLFDDSRADGDTGIVETTYGYHIMYYLGEDAEMPAWKVLAINIIASERTDTWFKDSVTKYAVTINDNKLDKVIA